MLETPLGWAILLILGMFTGVLSGLLGIGGGLLMVPALTVFGVPLVQATATSLVGVFLSSVSGSLRNFKAGELNWRVSLLLAAFGIVTAQVGAWLGDRLPDGVLSLAFAGLLLITIYLMRLRQRLKQAQREFIETDRELPQTTDLSVLSGLSMPLQLGPIAGIGSLAGLLSGLFGVGGGVVMVPLQMLFLGETIKTAVRTSLGAIVAIAISGLAQHTWNGNVLWIPGLCLGLGGMLGAQAGTRLLPRLSDRTVNVLFRLFLIGLAVYMAIRAIRYWEG
ncbi:sulfite exporter TauE/SafE family protein [Thermocoleostomius sinensis]|uniref:Probable membrane transporter protein n=1 Tax=Thermocoleostomius sinensis A174 TaxID=2016057 RepID=A0A9E8ZIW1_9CYAN|nr:sulfite exporter TauE/SafE family protein [Thermocoleostomius sinensis]WAL62108.1 sulfite exporter TauE/SafE family protein [Thermocoleostomius sinensis A174]